MVGGHRPDLLFGGGGGKQERTTTQPLPGGATFYWLLVPSPQGYSVVEHRSALAVERGSVIALDGQAYRVSVVAPSPFLDGKPCAYLEPAPP